MDLIEHGLYRYREGAGWCRHGLVVIRNIGTTEKPDLVAVDTYWGYEPNHGALERNFYQAEKVKDKLEFIIDLSACRNSNEHEFQQYEEGDRAYIPMGGGSARWLVRRDAKPSIDLQLRQLNAEAEAEKRKIESAVWAIARAHEQIALLRRQREDDERARKAAEVVLNNSFPEAP